MSERTLVPSQSRSFQVPAIIADVGITAVAAAATRAW
jgi:hypothetical protein